MCVEGVTSILHAGCAAAHDTQTHRGSGGESQCPLLLQWGTQFLECSPCWTPTTRGTVTAGPDRSPRLYAEQAASTPSPLLQGMDTHAHSTSNDAIVYPRTGHLPARYYDGLTATHTLAAYWLLLATASVAVAPAWPGLSTSLCPLLPTFPPFSSLQIPPSPSIP